MSRNTTSPRTLTTEVHNNGEDIFRVIDMKVIKMGMLVQVEDDHLCNWNPSVMDNLTTFFLFGPYQSEVFEWHIEIHIGISYHVELLRHYKVQDFYLYDSTSSKNLFGWLDDAFQVITFITLLSSSYDEQQHPPSSSLMKWHGWPTPSAHSLPDFMDLPICIGCMQQEKKPVGIDVDEQLDYQGMDVNNHETFKQVKDVAGPSNILHLPLPPTVTSKCSGCTVHMPQHFIDYLSGSATHLAHMAPTNQQE
ncbi:hypothetical protein BDR04DRAFT_1112217 [Suillus decipiens]|nr:hypothetical protein BDR04DRAFT_1112217 [Suillus decipiens]